ncbi:thiol:disulfide interchange protein TlpA [Methylobacterium platani]|uniref:Thiol:disulfide interchange protein n=2 Tax=Methylobacterium platani TaxID=427683 RepID=A0A179S7W9_9HYPH|nr:TlpA disulfide reductase family protein [Methylobacterium platani]KMO10999.1 thiol:disulfide interchange protein [Methylobacterium platani JCM 14648]OAS20996.1 thiol:disulfide interchange protein [Methylobacterium platani]
MSSPRLASSRTTRLALAGGLVAVLGLGAALYGLGDRSNGGACPLGAATAARLAPLARGEVAALQVDAHPKPAPAITFTGPDGRPKTLADLKGRTVLLNLWATWCAPCKAEMPALDRLQGELGGPDFEVVALNLDTRNPERPPLWMKENGIARLAYYADPGGRALPVLQKTGDVVGLPTTFLIDPAGCEIGVMKGPAEWASEDAVKLVRAALGRG